MFEFTSRLPGPSTTEAVIIAGPNVRHHENRFLDRLVKEASVIRGKFFLFFPSSQNKDHYRNNDNDYQHFTLA